MADLVATKPAPLVGLALPFTPVAAGGDTVPNTTKQLVFRNTNAAARVVTIVSQVAARPGVMADDIEVNVPPAGVVVLTGLNAAEVVNEEGRVELTYSAAADLTVAVLG